MQRSSRRRNPYIQKTPSTQMVAQEARQQEFERPLWRTAFGDRSVEDVALSKLRLWVLQQCGGVRAQAARVLGISERGFAINLQRYKALGLQVPPAKKSAFSQPLPDTFWKELLDRLFFLGFDN